jgi:hypothetical protein
VCVRQANFTSPNSLLSTVFDLDPGSNSWVGAYRAADGWRYVDSSSASGVLNCGPRGCGLWLGGQPDNANYGSEDKAAIVAANNGRLGDFTWSNSYPYTCQRTWTCSGACDPYRGVQVRYICASCSCCGPLVHSVVLVRPLVYCSTLCAHTVRCAVPTCPRDAAGVLRWKWRNCLLSCWAVSVRHRLQRIVCTRTMGRCLGDLERLRGSLRGRVLLSSGVHHAHRTPVSRWPVLHRWVWLMRVLSSGHVWRSCRADVCVLQRTVRIRALRGCRGSGQQPVRW